MVQFEQVIANVNALERARDVQLAIELTGLVSRGRRSIDVGLYQYTPRTVVHSYTYTAEYEQLPITAEETQNVLDMTMARAKYV